MEPIKCSRGRGVGSALPSSDVPSRNAGWNGAVPLRGSHHRPATPASDLELAHAWAVGHLSRRRPAWQARQATRAHWPLPRRSHRTDGLERRRTGTTTQSTLHRLPTLRAGNSRSHRRVQMIQSGVTRAVRAWAGEASSRLAAKSRAQKLRRLSRAPIEALEAIEIVAGSSGAIGAIGVESPASRPGEDAGGERWTRKYSEWRLGTCTNTRTGGWLTTSSSPPASGRICSRALPHAIERCNLVAR